MCNGWKLLSLLYVDPANKHDVRILKENVEDFANRFRGKVVVLDKGYVSKKLSDEMRGRGVKYIAIKKDNMLKSEEEKAYYKTLSRIRRIIETRFSQLEEFGLRFIRAISRKGLAVKIILSILAFNIHQMMRMGI